MKDSQNFLLSNKIVVHSDSGLECRLRNPECWGGPPLRSDTILLSKSCVHWTWTLAMGHLRQTTFSQKKLYLTWGRKVKNLPCLRGNRALTAGPSGPWIDLWSTLLVDNLVVLINLFLYLLRFFYYSPDVHREREHQTGTIWLTNNSVIIVTFYLTKIKRSSSLDLLLKSISLIVSFSSFKEYKLMKFTWNTRWQVSCREF